MTMNMNDFEFHRREPDLELNRPLPGKYGQMYSSKNYSVTTVFLLVNCCTFSVSVTVIFIFQLLVSVVVDCFVIF